MSVPGVCVSRRGYVQSVGIHPRKGPGTRETHLPKNELGTSDTQPPRRDLGSSISLFGQTYACENITFPKLRLRAVTIQSNFLNFCLPQSVTFVNGTSGFGVHSHEQYTKKVPNKDKLNKILTF